MNKCLVSEVVYCDYYQNREQIAKVVSLIQENDQTAKKCHVCHQKDKKVVNYRRSYLKLK